MFNSLQQILGASDTLREEQSLFDTRLELMRCLGKVSDATDAAGSSDLGSSASSSSNAVVDERSSANKETVNPADAVVRVLEGWEGTRLLKLVISLQPEARRKVLALVQRVCTS
jgi:hypothetical protein